MGLRTCFNCSGEGIIKTFAGSYKCPICHGTGKVSPGEQMLFYKDY